MKRNKNIFFSYAKKTLLQNRSRTLVTIIGIILSVSMVTAVTTLVSSLQRYLYQVSVAEEGDWHGAVYHQPKEKWSFLDEDDQVESYVTAENIGYGILEGCENPDKPYLFISGVTPAFVKKMPVEITSGRMPTREGELLIPDHVRSNGGVYLELGDQLTLEVGCRISGGSVIWQDTPYQSEEDGGETLAPEGTAVYTVVGFYERPSFEARTAPGYTALTVADGSRDNYNVYFKMNDPKTIYSFLEQEFSDEYEEETAVINTEVLLSMGVSGRQSFNRVLTNLSIILIGIIMIGSISLIYNAFSISVSERTRQFGLIGSIGATRKQMISCVLYEALLLSAVGIPLGILAGTGGIWLTLKLVGGMLDRVIYSSGISFSLYVTWWALLAAAGVGLVTVLVSAWLPARRAMKISPIDAIRQTSDIRIKARKVKTSRLIYRLFGFEGMVAVKNLKRSRKKYRITVFSLFISIVLFVAASSFCAYLKYSADTVADTSGIDLICECYDENEEEQEAFLPVLDDLTARFAQIPQVEKQTWNVDTYEEVLLDEQGLSRSYRENGTKLYGKGWLEKNRRGDEIRLYARIYYINDQDYRTYLKENGLDEERYLNSEDPTALIYPHVVLYNGEEGKYYPVSILDKQVSRLEILRQKEIEGMSCMRNDVDENLGQVYIYTDEEGNEVRYPAEEVEERIQINAGEYVDALPFGIRERGNDRLICLLPYSAKPRIDSLPMPVTFYFQASQHRPASEKIEEILKEKQLGTEVYDLAESRESEEGLLIIINVFSYGFIILISLITAANVFNTISTNINLRRREFAMLRSMGMSQKGFYRMMRFECLFYGLKGLLYGLPAAILVTFLIYLSVNEGIAGGFFVPWYSVCIVVVSVFLVVFSTMLYATGKVKKENTVDALKNENY